MADGADQKEMKKRLKKLMSVPDNQVCSDCSERQPRWASLIVPPPGAPEGTTAIGAFCCLECSGSHRRLGVHISFVRSVNLDSWKEKEVIAMENGGNAKVNAIFESKLSMSGVTKPTNHADLNTRERFIRDKYERRKFYDPRGFEDYAATQAQKAPDPVRKQSGEIVLPALDTSTGTSGSYGAPVSFSQPSEAARRRVEERKNRLKKASSNIDSAESHFVADFGSQEVQRQSPRRTLSSGGSRKNVPAAPHSAPVQTMDLLDFSGEQAGPATDAAAPKSDFDLFDMMPSSGGHDFSQQPDAFAQNGSSSFPDAFAQNDPSAFQASAFPSDPFAATSPEPSHGKERKERTKSPKSRTRSPKPPSSPSKNAGSAPSSPSGKDKPRRNRSGRIGRTKSGDNLLGTSSRDTSSRDKSSRSSSSKKGSEDILALYNNSSGPAQAPNLNGGADFGNMASMMQQMNAMGMNQKTELDGTSIHQNDIFGQAQAMQPPQMNMNQFDFSTMTPQQQQFLMQQYQQHQLMMMMQQSSPNMMNPMMAPNVMGHHSVANFGNFMSAAPPTPQMFTADNRRSGSKSSLPSSGSQAKRDPFADLGR